MLRLDATTKILQLVASDTANVIVAGSSKSASAYTGFSQETAATASTQTICNAPAASTVTDVDHVTIKNTGASNTVTVQMLNSSGAVTTQITQAVLAANETLEYTHATGWKTLDASGFLKLSMPGYLPLSGGTISGALTLSGALTYGGVTLTNAVTGTGKMVLDNNAALVAPALGTPASGTLTNCTGLPIAGTTGYGTGVATALAVNVGSAGAFLTFNGDAGTPSALVGTNISGTAASLTAGVASAVAASGITGTTLNASVVTSSLTTVGALNSGSITNGFGSIDVGADAISGGAITGTSFNINSYDVGTWTTPAFVAGDFTGDSSMTWTVAAGDITNMRYTINNKVMTINGNIATTTVGGTPSADLRMLIPAGKTAAKTNYFPYFYNQGTWALAGMHTTAGSTLLVFNTDTTGSANWATGTDNTYLEFSITFEIQ